MKKAGGKSVDLVDWMAAVVNPQDGQYANTDSISSVFNAA